MSVIKERITQRDDVDKVKEQLKVPPSTQTVAKRANFALVHYYYYFCLLYVAVLSIILVTSG